ncbi:MAG: ATP-binding protein [Rhodospirillaceae bacterium]
MGTIRSRREDSALVRPSAERLAAAGDGESAIKQGEQIVRSIAFAVGAVAFVLILLSFFAGYSEYNLFIKDSERRVESDIAASEQNIKLAISSLESVMRAIGERIRAGGVNHKSLNDFLFTMDHDLPATRALLVVNPTGLIAAESRPERLAVGIDVSDRTYFTAHKPTAPEGSTGEGELFIGPPIRSRVDNAWLMPISRPVRDDKGALLAVVVASIDLRYIAKLFSSIDAGPHKLEVLIHRDGTVLSVFPFDFTLIGRSVLNTPLFEEYLPRAGLDVVHGPSTVDTSERIVAYRAMNPWPLVLEVSMRRDDALGHFLAVAIGWVTLLILFLMMTIYLAFRQISQTRQLAQQAVVIQHQIGKLKETYDELQREMSDRRYAEWERDRLFDLSIDMLCIATIDGYFRRVNPAVVANLGYGEEELLSTRMIDFVHPEDVEDTLQEMRDLAEGRPMLSFENRFRRKDGSFRWFSWNAFPQDNLVYSVARDVTEQKAVAAQLEQALYHAEAANRAKSDFLANMSHELRTPLNGVIGYAEALGLGIFGMLTTKQIEYVNNIRNAGTLLLGIVNDLLDLSVVEAGRQVLAEGDADIAVLVQAVLALVRDRAAHKHLTLTCRLPEPAPLVRCDELKIKQVLVNLAVNAIKFTEPGGTILIEAGIEPDGDLYLAIIDNGIGIASFDLPKVMTPFGQVEPVHARKQGGVGLGLPLAKKLIELHGGTLTLESAVGVGTTARVTIPAQRVIRSDGVDQPVIAW